MLFYVGTWYCQKGFAEIVPDTPKPPPTTPSSTIDIAEGGLTPSNIRKKPKNPTAVAITTGETTADAPRITAAGRGKIAEQILQLLILDATLGQLRRLAERV